MAKLVSACVASEIRTHVRD